MNKYIFNWNAVLAHCPEYQKYLVDIASLKDNAEEDVIPELNDSGLLGNRTDEELDIIREMNGEALQPTGRDVHGRRIVEEADSSEKDTTHYILNPVYEDQPLPAKMNPLQLMPPKCILNVGSKMYFPGKTGWHICYQISSNEYTGKSVDMVKTKVIEKADKVQLVTARYWFDQNRNLMSERRSKFKCLTYNKKTHNLYYIYRARTRKKGSKVKRYTSNVRGVLLHTAQLGVATTCVDDTLLKSFIYLVEKAVLSDIPDAHVPTQPLPKPRNPWNFGGYKVVVDTQHISENEFLQSKLLILILQHKANTRLDWLNPKVLANIDNLIAIEGFEEQISGINIGIGLPVSEQTKYYTNDHKKRVRKIVPTLRASKSLKALTKVICGKFYAKILMKFMGFDEISKHRWIDILQAVHHDYIPKLLYHWLSDLMNNGITEGKESVEVVVQYAIDTLRDINAENEQERARNITILELWVKTSKRFLKQGGFVSNWFTWRDMYRMADTLNIRLRSNKFKDMDDVKRRHDLLSGLINRDRSVLRDYIDVIFREFDIPDKEYDGFTFTQLSTVEELVHEGKTMHHCVGGYASQCVRGSSIIFSMRKGNRGYVTIELDGTSLPYHIRQKYTIGDVSVVNESALETINNWIEAVNNIHGHDKTTYAQECETISNTLKVENKLKNLTKLKEEADGDILTHINDECNKLECQLAALTQTPLPNTNTLGWGELLNN